MEISKRSTPQRREYSVRKELWNLARDFDAGGCSRNSMLAFEYAAWTITDSSEPRHPMSAEISKNAA